MSKKLIAFSVFIIVAAISYFLFMTIGNMIIAELIESKDVKHKSECRPSTGDKIGVTYANGECHILPKRMIVK